MAVQIEIKAPNLDSFLRKMRKFPNVAVRSLNRALNKTLLQYEREVKILTPVDTGRLRGAYRKRVFGLTGAVFNRVPYGEAVHNLHPVGQPYKPRGAGVKGKKNPRARAGFVVLAVEKVNEKVEDIFKKEMDKGLEEISNI